MDTHADPVPDPTARHTAADDVAADLIARCPEHGTSTETWPECRCAAARKAAAWLAGNPDPAEDEQREQDERQIGLAHDAGEHAMCGPDCQAAAVAQLVADRATTEARAALAPLAAAVRERQARHDAEVRAAALRDAADRLLSHSGPHTDGLQPDGPGFWWDTRDRDAAAVLLLQWAGESSSSPSAEQLAADKLPEWLCQRFGGLTPALRTRSFWEDEADAVRRAVAQGGFQAEQAVGRGEVVGEIVGPTRAVLNEVYAERARQDDKWGEQNHRDGTGDRRWRDAANHVRGEVDDDARYRRTTWNGVLREELFEALAESDPARLRAELVQVAAVAVAWVEAIDRRTQPGAEQ